MNIILVVFDTLRRDCVGVYGHPAWGEVQVPNFQAFAAQSLVMTRRVDRSGTTAGTWMNGWVAYRSANSLWHAASMR